MGILDELKQEADQLKNQELERQRYEEMLERRFRDDLDPKMQSLHAYLRELVQQLNVVKPEVPVDYELQGSPPLKGLMQQEYFLGQYAERKFSLLFVCKSERKQVFELDNPVAIERQKEYFTNSAVKFYCKELKNDRYEVYKATFVLQGQVKCAMEFRANPKEGCIDLNLRNFAAIGRATASFSPETIDEAFMDELGQYLLRRSNRLLERRIQRMSDEHRAAIRRQVEEENRQREEEMRRIEEEEARERQAQAAGKRGLLGKLIRRKE